MVRSVIDVPDLTPEELDSLMDTAEDIIARPDDYADACRRKKLATLFFEPSTRTRLSVLLNDVRKQYDSVVASANTAVSYASAELRKMDVALSQLPLAFDAGKSELDKLEKSVYLSEK